MDNQDWKNIIIDGKETNYEIDSGGIIRNKNTKHELATSINVNGYYFCNGLVDKKQHTLYVHKLLAEYFVPNPKNYTIAYHLDGNKSNNKVSNIGWTTRSDAVTRGNATKKRFKKINQYADSDKTQLIATYDSVLDASEKLGIHRTTVTKFLTGKRTSDKVFISYAK